jgi:hypothetical protein
MGSLQGRYNRRPSRFSVDGCAAASLCSTPAGTATRTSRSPLDGRGRHAKPELTLGFPEGHLWIAYAMGHLDLLSRAEVYEKIRSWLSS